ncbi:IS200/IS605 family accessory protein TnpB-related protein [Campylobacter coli]|nr:IS200/IS605 family accessory protein TnpB-related protein [Campylobacter coli]
MTKIKNQRNDYHHKISRELADKFKVICLENLKVKNMVKNRKLAKYINNVNWSSFIEKLSYKIYG